MSEYETPELPEGYVFRVYFSAGRYGGGEWRLAVVKHRKFWFNEVPYDKLVIDDNYDDSLTKCMIHRHMVELAAKINRRCNLSGCYPPKKLGST